MAEPQRTRDRVLRVHRALRPGFGTEAAVSGTIMVSGLIAVSAPNGKPSVAVLVTVVVTVIVFWAAHLYAGTVVFMGTHRTIGVRGAIRRALPLSFGVLGSSAIPTLILLAGTTRLIPDEIANDVALWSGTIVLAFLGYVAFLRRGSTRFGRLAGSLTTASFGIVFVILNALLH
ncbi:hypothetical protein [Microbacterium sp. Leaf320]|uniref:hypothetical protein n=1 Tax=Microbacterium sp. Leaf320 TaxID=1736334 RepID=UPI000A8063BD|nr:hypothetical protein [Microbacterium sp. Leaf320]